MDEGQATHCSICAKNINSKIEMVGSIGNEDYHLILCELCFKTAFAALMEKKRIDNMFDED